MIIPKLIVIFSESGEEEGGALEGLPDNAIPPEPQQGKKRVRRVHTWKRVQRKKLRNAGQSYVDRKHNIHRKKEMQPYNHNCRYKCTDNIPLEQRQGMFDSYWKLESWELQTAFLNGAIELQPVKRSKETAVNRKGVSCVFHLGGYRVCKQFFLKTLDESNKRVRNVIVKKKTGVPLRDQRGRKEPANKIPNPRIEIIREHIRNFPRYHSHYSREKAPNMRYLNPYLNLSKMYDLYTTFCQEVKNIEPEKESFYRKIFQTEFKLSFHRPQTDTCVTCDRLQIKIVNGTNEEKKTAETEKELHLRKAEAAKDAKKEYSQANDKDTICICFDLQKMMPTPNVKNSKAYYLRQLWTYNLDIHDLKTKTGHMYMWHEGQAGRGCQEIASCLLKYITSLPPHVKHLVAFSDNCGGQNKSHLITKFWLYIVKNTRIETVTHRFLVSGHSYNECDQDFGLIEVKKKKSQRYMYVPKDWVDLVASSSRKFIVTLMEDDDFIDILQLNTFFPKTVKGIRGMQVLHFKKSCPTTLFYKTTAGSIDQFKELSMVAYRLGRLPAQLPVLQPAGMKPKLKKKKYENLMELLQFVPPIYHQFYIGLPHNTTTEATTPVVEEGGESEADNVYDTDTDD